MPEDDATPCPLLSDTGACLVYAHRPMICRLHGLPNIDISGEDFTSEVCSLNSGSADPEVKAQLRWRFRETFSEEIAMCEDFTELLTGTALRELDTFIPTALLIDFPGNDWPSLVRRYASR